MNIRRKSVLSRVDERDSLLTHKVPLLQLSAEFGIMVDFTLLFFLLSVSTTTFAFSPQPRTLLTTTSSPSSSRFNSQLKMAPASETPYKKFIVKRSIPGAGTMTASELVAAGCGSCKANEDLGSKCCWITSYVVPEGTYCIYAAADEEDVRCHACKITPDAPFEITEVVGNLDCTGAYLRHASCK